jgi:heme-degrading monooxygenase HmoA
MGEEKPTFVCATILELAASEFERISQEAAQLARGVAPNLPGFIEVAVLGSEEKTRLLILSRWESKDAWARAEWDNEVGRAVTKLAASASSYDVRTFLPVAIVRAP